MTPLRKLIREAYGCRLPVVQTAHLQDLGEHQLYSIALPEWDVVFPALVSTYDVSIRLSVQRPNFTPEISHEQMEAYLYSYQFSIEWAIAYALITIPFQTPEVMRHLHGRFSALLPQAQELAQQWHRENVKAAMSSSST